MSAISRRPESQNDVTNRLKFASVMFCPTDSVWTKSQSLPILWNKHQTEIDPLPDRFILQLPIAEPNVAAGFRVEPHETFEKFLSCLHP